MSDHLPRVTVIVVSWNVKSLLRECLASVAREAPTVRGGVEVIVVDNASRDGSAEMARVEFPEARVIANRDNVGFGRANNQALAFASGMYLLLLNPDAALLPGSLSRLSAVLDSRPGTRAAGARLLNSDGSLQRWTGGAFPSLWNVACHYLFLSRLLPAALRPPSLYLEREADGEIDVDWVCGACLLLRRDAVGDFIFDPGFFLYGEDMELCQRIRATGGNVVYTPRASVVHHQGASIRQQKGGVLLSSLKGPRRFFSLSHSRAAVFAFDALTVAGFLVRWLAYGAAARLRSSAALRDRCASSRSYLGLALRVMRGD
jgi:GT2 family glycosyltransferase